MSSIAKQYEVGDTVEVIRESLDFKPFKATILQEVPEEGETPNTLTVITKAEAEKISLIRAQGTFRYYTPDDPAEQIWLSPLVN